MLGTELAGVLSSDDFSVYNVGKVAAQQKCLAHLRRHFKKVLGLPGNNNAAVAQIFLSLIDEAFIAHESGAKDKGSTVLDRGFIPPIGRSLFKFCAINGNCNSIKHAPNPALSFRRIFMATQNQSQTSQQNSASDDRPESRQPIRTSEDWEKPEIEEFDLCLEVTAYIYNQQ
ncbi:pyrroloquinoline quinone precursor peptide PqqA [Microcoleus sp. T3B2]